MPTIDFESLQQLFPTDADIPEDARLPAPIHQRVSLVDGELVPWDGTCKTVLSPVCVRQASGEAEQVAIGSYPVMGETESDAALDAAVRAYDHGRGAWPTMTVGQRIACMQDFIRRMVAERQPDREPDHVGDRQEPRRFARRSSTAPSATCRTRSRR